MKKRNFKSLKLNKKSISNLETMLGGRLDKVPPSGTSRMHGMCISVTYYDCCSEIPTCERTL